MSMAGAILREYQIEDLKNTSPSKWLDLRNGCIAEYKNWAALDDCTPTDGIPNIRERNTGLNREF